MSGMEKSATARLPAAAMWMRRGEDLAKAVAAAAVGVKGGLRRVASAMTRAQARREAMRTLYALDDRMLQDIGLRRDQVESTVAAMFRRDPDAEAAQPAPQVNAAETTDMAAADAGNDRHYQSAA